jgi:penicillin-binding protein 1C
VKIDSRRRLFWVLASIFAAFLILPLSLVTTACFLKLPAALKEGPPEHSIRIEDCNGHLLREVRSKTGALSQWVPLSALPPSLPRALVAVEDRRFFSHKGVDPVAVLRAAAQAMLQRRIVSGASTLTMQLARSLQPHRRSFWAKYREMALALRIEASVSKRRILEEYLNRVDFGPNLRGIGAAAQGYFGKPVFALSLGEVALLVGMPQGPSVYALNRHPERALHRRNRVLDRLSELQLEPNDAIEQARSEPLHLDQRRPAFGAPHFVSALVHGAFSKIHLGIDGTETRGASRIRTTLDPILQRATETAISSVVATLHSHAVRSAAAIVVDNASGDVLAYVGSPNFYDESQQGQVDGVRALRQPGSTLKPFVYAGALEELGYTAATVLPDLELHIATEVGDYCPRNFDDKYRGPVRLREALGNSLNVPAVYAAVQLGPPTLLRMLHAFGFDSLNQRPEYYGPALALGDGEVTLIELVRAYATLARGGAELLLRVVSELDGASHNNHDVLAETRKFESVSEARVVSPATAAIITDILKDKTARAASFGLQSALQFDFEVAAKTGTSKGYRDNWVVGYSHRVTVGVWVGNFDGSPMRQVGGITGAAPIFHAILDAAMAATNDLGLPIANGDYDNKKSQTATGTRRVEICPVSGQAIGPDCPHAIQ